MVVLLTKKTSGRRRSCNARCYGAKGKTCTCLCGSLNHGVGLLQATQNTQERAGELESGVEVGIQGRQLILRGID